MKKRPNFLFLMGDEHPVQMMTCYGNQTVISPFLDSLAEKSVVFDAAYCPSPICASSRASMMTSKFSSEIEVWDNSSPLRSDWPTFAHSFSAAGYKTILCGKMHFVGPDQFHGFQERWTQDIYPATFEWTRSNRKEVAVNTGQTIDRVFEAGIDWTKDMDYDEEVFFRAKNGLRRLSQQGEPFFLCVSFTGPHYPFKAPKKYWDMYEDVEIPLPKIPEDYLDREHEYVKWLRKHGKFETLVPDEICKKARRAIYARISMLDDYLKEIYELLDELQLGEDTIVVYASDHGDMMGEHGLWYKNAAYEGSSRVPLLFSGAGIAPRRVTEPVNLMDLGKTFCALAGIDEIYSENDGKDLSKLVFGEESSLNGYTIMENYAEGVHRGWRMIRKGNFKLNYIPGHGVELFDLEKDPGEWQDLSKRLEYKSLVDDMVQIVTKNWDPDLCDEKRYQSEERRLAILKSGLHYHWDLPSSPVPHPFN